MFFLGIHEISETRVVPRRGINREKAPGGIGETLSGLRQALDDESSNPGSTTKAR